MSLRQSIEVSRRTLKRVLGVTALGAALAAQSLAATPSDERPTASPDYGLKIKSTGPLGHHSFDTIKQIDAGILSVGYAEAGPANGQAVILLHGWPYDIYSFVDVAPVLAASGYHVIVPYLRGYGTTTFLSSKTFRSGQPSAVAADIMALMDALKIKKAIVGGFDWGARTADIMAILWPDRVKGIVSVSGYLLSAPQSNKEPLPPEAEYQWWYQFYFATERGESGYAKYHHDFDKLIWRLASPKWSFDDATYERTAAAFDNPDHVRITIHNYRFRLGLAKGEPRYDSLESRLASSPAINVPAITMEGDANGAPHAPASAYASKFTGKYEYRLIKGGVGHNLPQEAPGAFAQAIIDVDHLLMARSPLNRPAEQLALGAGRGPNQPSRSKE